MFISNQTGENDNEREGVSSESIIFDSMVDVGDFLFCGTVFWKLARDRCHDGDFGSGNSDRQGAKCA